MSCPQNAEQINSFSNQAWLKLAERSKSSNTASWASLHCTILFWVYTNWFLHLRVRLSVLLHVSTMGKSYQVLSMSKPPMGASLLECETHAQEPLQQLCAEASDCANVFPFLSSMTWIVRLLGPTLLTCGGLYAYNFIQLVPVGVNDLFNSSLNLVFISY